MYKKIKQFGWALYPLAAAVFVVLSLNITDQARQGGWEETLRRQERIAKEEERVVRLEAKLAALGEVREAEVEASIGELLEAVPASKQLFAMVAELKAAATRSGVKLEKYSANVGEIKEASVAAEQTEKDALQMTASLLVFDMPQLRDFLETLEGLLPIVRVNQIKYTNGNVQVTLEQAISPWTRSGASVDQKLPEYRVKMDEVRRALSVYNRLPKATDDLELELSSTSAAQLGGSLF